MTRKDPKIAAVAAAVVGCKEQIMLCEVENVLQPVLMYV